MQHPGDARHEKPMNEFKKQKNIRSRKQYMIFVGDLEFPIENQSTSLNNVYLKKTKMLWNCFSS